MSEHEIVDLRSDTFTRPGSEMYHAMAEAPVGDDVYGEDETVNLLEATAARLLNKQAALFVSSATQANLIAMMTHCRRGEEVISGDRYHVIVAEAGGALRGCVGSLTAGRPLAVDVAENAHRAAFADKRKAGWRHR